MSNVSKICIAPKSGEKMIDIDIIEVLANKGIVNDRYFDENNEIDNQITLIESENIDHYNDISNSNIPYVDFRRNIITKGVRLNDLVKKKFLVGGIKLKGIRLCDPCKYLQDMLNDNKLVKKLTQKGGLRCQIITSGNISVNDEIKTI
tara:strand:+ start:240 stop:683 length:444 start_codon:yes stop_codon:yes gene_type:complete